jgi:hypothetical protein
MKAPRLFVVLALSGVTNAAWAQDDAANDDAYQQAADGLREFKAGHYAQALDSYTRAYSIVHLPALAVHIARANVSLGRFVTALRFYDEAVKLSDGVGDPRVQARARTDAQAEGRVLLLRIPKLVLQVSGVAASATSVSVDGARLPADAYKSGWLVDPGSHQVTASFGTQQQSQWISVSDGQSRELVFTFQSPHASATPFGQVPVSAAEASRESSTMRTAAWVGFGVGGTGLLMSGIAGLLAMRSSNHADETGCSSPTRSNNCDETAVGNYRTYRTLAGVGFYTGLAGVVTGTALYLSAPRQKKSRETTAVVLPLVGLGLVGAEGKF